MSGDDEYQLTCGARVVGGWNVSYPLAKLMATREVLRITMAWFWKFDLPRDRIASIRPHKGMMSKGILIDSSVVGADLILWTSRQSEALEALGRLGYPVSKMQSQATSWNG